MSVRTMHSVKYCDIPTYLRAGEFFRGLASDDPESLFEIPDDKFHGDSHHVANIKEFRDLLGTIDFWVLDVIPHGILDFCEREDPTVWVDEIFRFPEAVQVTCLAGLVTAYSATTIGDYTDVILTGRREVVEHVFETMEKDSVATAAAARAGNLPLVIQLHEEGFFWHKRTCTEASSIGNFSILQYAHENGCPWSSEVFDYAAQGDFLDCIQYAHEEGLKPGPHVCDIAAQFGSINCLTYMHQHGFKWDSNAVTFAVQAGETVCLEYLLLELCPYSARICDTACSHNQAGCLALLLASHADCDVETSHIAARNVDDTCLRTLHEYGCPWNAMTTRTALYHRHVNTLSYAMEGGCPYDSDIVDRAASGGSLQCLQYLVEVQAMMYTENTLFAALLSGNLSHLQYLLDQGCPMGDPAGVGTDNGCEIYDKYFIKDNPDFLLCVEWAVERGWVASDYFVRYIITRDISNCAKLIVKHGWLAYTSTGEGFIKFVKGVSHNDNIPSVSFVLGKDSVYFDNVFSRSWDVPSIKRNLPLIRSVHFAMLYGWQPDDPIRHITGIPPWYCRSMRIIAFTLILCLKAGDYLYLAWRVLLELVFVVLDNALCVVVYKVPAPMDVKFVAYFGYLLPVLARDITDAVLRLRNPTYPTHYPFPDIKID